METLKFKTNLKCNNCVAKVKSRLDHTVGINNWSIDLKSPDRILTIETNDKQVATQVEQILKDAGYHSEFYSG